MSHLSTVPGHIEATPESVEAYERAVAQMPAEAIPAILARLDAGVRHAERSGDIAPLRHTLDSILMTARLQHNEAYLRAIADADAEDARGEHHPVDVVDFVAGMRAKYGS